MIEYEYFHLNSDNRKNWKYLDILHPEFEEFGQSGKVFKKEDFIEVDLDSNEYEILNFNEVQLSNNSYLCKYILVNKSSGMASNRSSIWVLYKDEWKLIFHQGTKVSIWNDIINKKQ